MKFQLPFLVLIILINFCESRLTENLKVEIEDGQVIGRYMTSISGRAIRSFTGIPYASPPVGDLRFKAPIKPVPWNEKTLIAQNDVPSCPQTNIYDRSEKRQSGQEDCLYLNVYAPNVNVTDKGFKKLPVMVWLHGGGWIEGYSGYNLYGPGYLLDHNIVLVTGNYRLGILGFLSTEDENCPGNFGFKDQHMILEWVQANIETFGGDKDSVTIFGESAGGGIVSLLMNNPKSRKLFHRAIAQSGNLMNMWSEPLRKGLAKERATKVAELMECPTDSTTEEMIKCLRSVPAEKISAVVHNFMVWDYDPIIPFGPVVEESGPENERFIVDNVLDRQSFNIPFMTGITSDEMLFKITGILKNQKLRNDILQNWETIFPASFQYDHLDEKQIKEINSAICDFYSGCGANGENLTMMYTDGFFVQGFIDNLHQRLRSGNQDNTFVYKFSHKGSISLTEVFGTPEEYVGTCHIDDLLYLFPMRNTFPHFFNSIPTVEDEMLRKIMTKLWVDFAATGNPTPNDNFWTPASKFPLDYLRIGNKNGNSDKLFEMEKDLFEDRAQFWINLRKKYGLRVWKNGNKEEL